MNLSFNLKILVLVFVITLIFSFISCKGKNNPNDPPIIPVIPDIGKAEVWLTRGDQLKLFSRESDLSIRTTLSQEWPVITIDTSIRFQSVDGYGAALTGSSAYLLNRKLGSPERETILKKLFDPETGIGISFLRLTMGASDFSLSDFTYNDLPTGQTDFALQNFSLSQDLQDVVPIMKQIIGISPNIFVMGSPWSPPAWMKTNNSLKGGKLRTDSYDVYADYFVKYIREMKNQGINITHVTPQNEPLYFTAAYPCMEMQANEQLNFIKNHLGPKFEAAADINTKIINYDHNWDNTQYSISILNDPAAANYTAGSAFHAYGGSVSAMSAVHNAHPDKELHFTEISGGAWAVNFEDNLMWYMRNIFIGTANNWSRSALMWNLALDQNYGPRNNGCSNCRGVITINQASGHITLNEEYYSIGHFSKVVRPGAERISLIYAQALTNIDAVAFMNTDGSKALVIANYDSSFKTFSVKQGAKVFSYSIPAKSVVSLKWE
ncbi:MAG: glycoside hydrolase family 30 beta sandwich domain-containing protein [Bacteroidales bacterium]|nr:glycoside hydrolase family 30 beta sandwich domain-containing protein [Bacteroidales bacterium]